LLVSKKTNGRKIYVQDITTGSCYEILQRSTDTFFEPGYTVKPIIVVPQGGKVLQKNIPIIHFHEVDLSGEQVNNNDFSVEVG